MLKDILLLMSLIGTPTARSTTEDTGIPQIGGCDSLAVVGERTVCRIHPRRREVTLWWPTTRISEVSAQFDGRELDPPTRRVDEGVQFRVAVPAGTHVLCTHLTGSDEKSCWALEPAPIDADIEAAWRVIDGRSEPGEIDRVMARLRDPRGLGVIPAARRQALLARLHWTRSELVPARRWISRATEALRIRGELSEASRGLQMLAYLAAEAGELAEAEAFLAQDLVLIGGHGDLFASHLATESRLLEVANDHAAAHSTLRDAVMWARRLDDVGLLAALLPVLADLETTYGGLTDVMEMMDEAELAPAAEDACYSTLLKHSRGWIELREGEAGGHPTLLLSARERLFEARESASTKRCSDDEIVDIELDQAFAALALGLTDEAAELMPPPESVPALAVDARSRYALARGRLAAQQGDLASAGAQLLALADRPDAPLEVRWLAAHHLARALDRAQRLDEAATVYEQAERLLDRWALVSPLDVRGRSVTRDPRKNGAYAVDVHLRREDSTAAACAARLARAREKHVELTNQLHPSARAAYLEYERLAAERELLTTRLNEAAEVNHVRIKAALARNDEELERSVHALRGSPWTAPLRGCGDLRPPATDEAILLYHPLPGERWASFGITSDGVRAHHWDETKLTNDPAEWSRVLLHPLRDSLAGKERIRVIASGAVERVPIHNLPWESGRPLLDQFVVVFSLDRPESPPHESERWRAVIAADPYDGLQAGREEREDLDAQLSGLGWGVASTNDALSLMEQLRGVPPELLIFNSHGLADGSFAYRAGQPLSAIDLLFVRAPRIAILSACSTGLAEFEPEIVDCRPRAELGDLAGSPDSAGLSVGEALILAGADQVLATQGTICDVDAGDLVKTMTAQFDRLAPIDLASALREAQRELARLKPASDGWKFRVITR